MRRSAAWYDANPERKIIDAEVNQLIDRILVAVELT